MNHGDTNQRNLVSGLEHVLFSIQLGMSSSQLTFIFSEGFKPPTRNQLNMGTHAFYSRDLFQVSSPGQSSCVAQVLGHGIRASLAISQGGWQQQQMKMLGIWVNYQDLIFLPRWKSWFSQGQSSPNGL